MSSNGKMSVCEGCQTEHEKKYTYGKCKWCEEKVCGWCSYDTKTGITCVKCGFRSRSTDDGMMWCEKRKYYIPTPAECERLAKQMKSCPYSNIFTPEDFAPVPAPTQKKKVKLIVVKKLTDMGKFTGWYGEAIARKTKETEDYHAGRIKTCEIDLRCDCCRVEVGEFPCGQKILSLCHDCRWTVRDESQVAELRRTKKSVKAVLEEYEKMADFEMRHRVWQKKVDTMTCDYCHQKRALMEERKPVDGVPTELVCMDCRVSK